MLTRKNRILVNHLSLKLPVDWGSEFAPWLYATSVYYLLEMDPICINIYYYAAFSVFFHIIINIKFILVHICWWNVWQYTILIISLLVVVSRVFYMHARTNVTSDRENQNLFWEIAKANNHTHNPQETHSTPLSPHPTTA